MDGAVDPQLEARPLSLFRYWFTFPQCHLNLYNLETLVRFQEATLFIFTLEEGGGGRKRQGRWEENNLGRLGGRNQEQNQQAKGEGEQPSWFKLS